ncbi:trigger factor [Allofustis seminis]|uniref:trigger factor n=1 Tax=Allofustis seminis TaxID=166939 RepID=UPI000382ADBC|nr:trigger factor [Allofustis seminis]
MTSKFEVTGPTSAKVSFSISKEKVSEGLDTTFARVRKTISAPGFRKGHVPRQIFNRMYGEEALYEDTLNALLPIAYQEAFAKLDDDLEIVGQPEIKVISMEKGKDWEIEALITTKPEVKLGQYEGLEVPKMDAEVTEEDVDARLEQERQQLKELVVKDDAEAAENGDTVVIDFEGSVDGEVFEGGSSKNFSLKLGSGQFIPGFEEQLVGKKSGEAVDVTVTFPEDYPQEDLAGKEAVFAVKVHEVKVEELPELDDDFAMDVDEDVETLAELREKLTKELKESKEASAKAYSENKALEYAVKNAEIADIPQVMIEEEANNQVQIFLGQFKQQGIDPEMYYNLTGQTKEDLLDQYRKQAKTSVAMNLVLEAIVKAEGFEATEEEMNKEIESLAEQYSMPVEQVKSVLSEDMLKHDVAIRKAIDLVTESAKAVLPFEEDSEEE